jgi:hypothetical protein
MDKLGWLRDIIYVLPLAALIWKAAYLAAEQKYQRKALEELQDTVARNKVLSDDVMKSVANSLNDLKIAVARIETRLEKKKSQDED